MQRYAFVIPGVDPRTGDQAIQVVCDRNDRKLVHQAITNVVRGYPSKVNQRHIKSKDIQLDSPYEFIIMTQEISTSEERGLIKSLCGELESALGRRRVACV